MEGKTLEKSYGNIKGKTFGLEMLGNTMTIRLPYITIENITLDNMEEVENQMMSETSKIKKVVIENEIVPDSTAYWLFYLTNLTEISGIENLDTSNVTDMNNMFYECSSLSSIDLSNFNTSNVTNMSGMFNRCSSLSSIDLSKFDTSNVKDMNAVFYNCTGLTSLDLSSFNTSNVTDMEMMFDGCSNLKTVNLQSFNTEKVTNMLQMFYRCESLESLDISSFDITDETEITNMLIDSNNDSLLCTVYVKNEEIKNILKNDSENKDLVIEVKQ